jgi:hypothetical protein
MESISSALIFLGSDEVISATSFVFGFRRRLGPIINRGRITSGALTKPLPPINLSLCLDAVLSGFLVSSFTNSIKKYLPVNYGFLLSAAWTIWLLAMMFPPKTTGKYYQKR